MSKNKASFRVTWAVDAFDTPTELQARMVETLETLGQASPNLSVQPAYVLAPESLELTVPLAGPWAASLVPRTGKAIETLLKDVKVKGLKKAHVIRQSVPSLNLSVKSLLRFAKSSRSDLILIGSHGRKGLTRFVLGSFAETVLLQTKSPVLVVGVSQRKITDVGPILFVTDLSDRSLKVFKQLLRHASVLGAPVEVFHAIPDPLLPVIQSGAGLLGGAWIPNPRDNSSVRKNAERAIEKFVVAARRAKVQCEATVDDTGKSVTQSVVDRLRGEPCRFVALAGQSGPMESMLLGSIARQILHESVAPVWVSRA